MYLQYKIHTFGGGGAVPNCGVVVSMSDEILETGIQLPALLQSYFHERFGEFQMLEVWGRRRRRRRRRIRRRRRRRTRRMKQVLFQC